MKFLILILLSTVPFLSTAAQTPSPTYSDTRQLLSKMDGTDADVYLKKLFEEAHLRQQDLIEALYDPEQKINHNSQKVMRYLAQSDMLASIEKWNEYRIMLKQDRWWPNVQPVEDVTYLKGSGRDLSKLVLQTFYRKDRDAWA